MTSGNPAYEEGDKEPVESSMVLNNVSGVIDRFLIFFILLLKYHLQFANLHRLKIVPFEKMLWRVSKGNVFVRFCDLDEEMVDPKTGEELLKSVFIIFYQGKALTNSVKKICEGFHATVYSCPASKVTKDTSYCQENQ